MLLYHRVNDVSRDKLTTSSRRFAEHLSILRRHYPVVPLVEGVAAVTGRRYLGPNIVAITFDDGYADNHEVAAPILQRFGLPATFFVTVGLIGTDEPFPHDARFPHRFRTLTWEEVRALAAAGFEIGSHGWSHRNLARADAEAVRRELRDSREVLERMLGAPVRSFAYPFGGREDITPAVRAEIRAAGYSLTASAYGGANCGTVDPDDILREAVSEAFDALAFRATIEGVALQTLRARLPWRGARRQLRTLDRRGGDARSYRTEPVPTRPGGDDT